MATAPALAESEPVVDATEVLEAWSHAITVETPGTRYTLQNQSVDLDAYMGERVTVSGAPGSGYQDGQVGDGPNPLRAIGWRRRTPRLAAMATEVARTGKELCR